MTIPDTGIVFAATGEAYRNLARRAARNVRLAMPDIEIDLFTDGPLDDPVFSKVILVEHADHRPKMEALRRSRFRRTVYLDSDIVMLTDISEVFEVLERADFVGVQCTFGNGPTVRKAVRQRVPAAFRQINSGVLGIRKSTKTDALLRQWESDFQELELDFDQALLRELLYNSDLRVIVLPNEYNVMHMDFLRTSSKYTMAPRILHMRVLHSNQKNQFPVDQPFDPNLLLPHSLVERINWLYTTDRTLDPMRNKFTPIGGGNRFQRFMHRGAAKLQRMASRVWKKLG